MSDEHRAPDGDETAETTDLTAYVEAQEVAPPPPPPPPAVSRAATPVRYASENVVVQAPMSYSGSAARIWKITKGVDSDAARIALQVGAVALIGVVWIVVTGWYILFGLLLVPYRLIRRGSRKRKVEELRHRETMAAIGGGQQGPPPPRP
jgi:hypothetical protein